MYHTLTCGATVSTRIACVETATQNTSRSKLVNRVNFTFSSRSPTTIDPEPAVPTPFAALAPRKIKSIIASAVIGSTTAGNTATEDK